MELRPFRSIRYSPATIAARGLTALIAPPDVAAVPAAAAPENVARLASAEDPVAAAALYKDWLAAGVLEKERRPGLWNLRQTFFIEGRPLVRDALIGLVRLGAREKGALLDPYDAPDPGRLDRRLALLRAVRADFIPAFVVARAPIAGLLTTTRAPLLTTTDTDGVRHDAFRIADYAEHVELQGAVKNVEAILADGEDLFEAAVAFSTDPDAAKLPGAKYKLCAVVDVEAPGLVARPVHRLLSSVADWNPAQLVYAASDFFETRAFDTAEDALASLDSVSRLRSAFVLVAPPEKATLFVLRDRPDALPWPPERTDVWRGLDAAAVEVALFGRLLALGHESVRDVTETSEALAAVARGDAQAAILTRPLTLPEIEGVVHAGERLPSRWTSFYPRISAGLFGVALEDPVY